MSVFDPIAEAISSKYEENSGGYRKPYKWQEFRITTSDPKLADLGVDNSEDSFISIDMTQVVSYYKNSNDETNEEMVSIMTKSGFRHDVFAKYEDVKFIIYSIDAIS